MKIETITDGRWWEETLPYVKWPSRSQRYLVGVSGGRDSVCLLDSLVRAGFKKLIVCHLNHGLRGRTSGVDERFVERLAKSHDLEFRTKKVDTRKYAKENKLSIEAAGREMRLAFFDEVAKEKRCRRLLLGHHADDQVETLLMNLARGSGLAGLGGMRWESKLGKFTVIRPLLNVWRSTIDKYIDEFDLKFREDKSNAGRKHVRNRVRHDLIPMLPEIFGRDPREALLRAAELCRDDFDYLNKIAHDVYKRVRTRSGGLSVARLNETDSDTMKLRVIHLWLRESGIRNIERHHVGGVCIISNPKSLCAKINLPGNWHARRRAGTVFL